MSAKKFIIPKRGIFLVRLAGEDVFHVHVDGEHCPLWCGFDYIQTKKRVKKEYPKRKINFLKEPWPIGLIP